MNNISRTLVGFILFILVSNNLKAQYYFYNNDYYYNPVVVEAGVSLNAMNCLTDLGGKPGLGQKFIKDLNIGKTHMAGGVYLNATYNDEFALRLEGTYGMVSANDNVLKGVTDEAKTRYNRNLSFRSTISEIALLFQIYPLEIYHNLYNSDEEPPKFSPYLIGGIGYFAFNPQAQLGNRWVDLQPLSTEGEEFPEYPGREIYKLQQLNYQIGVGLKYELTPFINLRMEFVHRILTTDYLDDCSTTYIDPTLYFKYFSGQKLADALALNDRQLVKITGPGGKRGDSKQNDSYFTYNIKIGFVLGREKIKK